MITAKTLTTKSCYTTYNCDTRGRFRVVFRVLVTPPPSILNAGTLLAFEPKPSLTYILSMKSDEIYQKISICLLAIYHLVHDAVMFNAVYGVVFFLHF